MIARVLSLLLLGTPIAIATVPLAAHAQTTAQLQSWRYDPGRQRLEITTTGGVRPSLFVLSDPPRIVVDLPNTLWNQPERLEPYNSLVRAVRISQFNSQTSRLILDLAQPLSESAVELQTAGAELWAVQINPSAATPPTLTPLLPPPVSQAPQLLTPPPPSSPTPIPTLTPLLPPPSAPTPVPTLTPLLPPSANQAPQLLTPPPLTGQRVQLFGLESTSDGFLVRTSGPATATTRRLTGPDRVVVDVFGGDIGSFQGERQRTINQLGVTNIRVGQFEPMIARVVLDVDPTSGDWETRFDGTGLRIVPAGGASGASLVPTAPSDASLATIRSVQLTGNRLEISADGFLFYRTGWNPETRAYQISVSPAQLPESMPDPGLTVNSPIERIRFVQENDRTVSILVQPAQDFDIREPNPGQGSRLIRLELMGEGLNSVASLSPQTIIPGAATVTIDAGHGGTDPGAIGVGGVQEKIVNLNIARLVQAQLQAAGVNVIMTRVDDSEIDLQPRVDLAVASGADIFVSIHTNALDRGNVSGIETYYLRPDSARLANVMHRYIVSGSGVALDRGVRTARFFVVRETPTTMPSVLLELGYLTNPTEGTRLATPEYQAQMAQAVTQGILAYLAGEQ